MIGWRERERWLAPLLVLGIAAAVLWVMHRELGSLQARDVAEQLREIPQHSLLRALLCTVLSYLLLGGFDLTGLQYVGKTLPYRRVALSSFIAYAIANNLGAAWITGGAVRYRLYATRVTGAQLATLQGFCSLTSLLGLATLTAISLLATSGEAARVLRLLQPWSSLLGMLLLGVVLSYLGWSSAARRAIEIRGWALRPPGARLALQQVMLGSIELCVAGAVLWSLLPAPAPLSFVGFLGVYCLAVAAGLVSHVPGGVGVFETMMLLAWPESSSEGLLGALIAYRAIYYLLPLLGAGSLFALREVHASRQRLARMELLLAGYITPLAPYVIGTTVLLAGVVLLVSGATPSINSRLHLLRELVPLPVLETSQLVGSLCGVGLMVLSRSLFRRVHEGYRLAAVLRCGHDRLDPQGSRCRRGSAAGVGAGRFVARTTWLSTARRAHRGSVHAGVDRRHPRRARCRDLARLLRPSPRRVFQ